MEDISVLILISISIPMLLTCIILKGRSRLVLIYLLLGIVAGILAKTINTFIMDRTDYTRFYLTINIAPVIEEILKAIPVIVLAFIVKRDRQTILESAIAIGLGFAMYENIYLISMSLLPTVSLAVLRGLGAGLMHSVCTLVVAFGITLFIEHKKWFFPGIVAILATAMTYHSIYNIFIQSDYMVIGIILPICTYVPITLFSIKRKNKSKK